VHLCIAHSATTEFLRQIGKVVIYDNIPHQLPCFSVLVSTAIVLLCGKNPIFGLTNFKFFQSFWTSVKTISSTTSFCLSAVNLETEAQSPFSLPGIRFQCHMQCHSLLFFFDFSVCCTWFFGSGETNLNSAQIY